MNIKEVKKIELTCDELLNILKRGLGVNENSTLKTSMRIPANIKFTIETEVKLVNGQIPRGSRDESLGPKVEKNIGPVSGKVCGNCSYPYTMGEFLHCPMVNKNINPTGSCAAFEPKPKEDIK